jgi:hypothetical protein
VVRSMSLGAALLETEDQHVQRVVMLGVGRRDLFPAPGPVHGACEGFGACAQCGVWLGPIVEEGSS